MSKIGAFFRYLFLTIVSIISAFPMLWMIVAATNKSIDVVRGRVLPGNYLVENFKTLVATQNVLGAMFNSFKYTMTLTVVSLMICSLAGYGFEVYHDRRKDRLMFIILLTTMIPFTAIMIPLFHLVSKANLLNCTLGFILPAIATPYLILMFRQAARAFQTEIIEAARIDGLSEIGIFFYMFIPTMRSTYGAAITVTFMQGWNSYLWPKVIMNDAKSITMPMLVGHLTEVYVTDYGVLMLAIFLCTLPTLLIFFLLQKRLTEGITSKME